VTRKEPSDIIPFEILDFSVFAIDFYLFTSTNANIHCNQA